MFIADVPNAPPLTPQVVLVAQANTGQQKATQRGHVLGICAVAYSGETRLSPSVYADSYFKMNGNSKALISYASAKVSIIKQPVHGSLEPDDDGDWRNSKYVANHGYLGNDSFVIQVEGNGYKVQLHYFMHITEFAKGVTNPNPVCKGERGRSFWKISLDANGNQVLTAIDPVSSQTDAINAMWNTQFGANGNVTLSFADLAAGALGQTTGTNITLDDNAANHNWFIDLTPGSNEEYLPTSNPYEWVAKEGTAAYGKMDMLSVLLHEYGHTLGIDHSADGRNYMATTLTAGVRRLPSAEELALMQQLVGEVKTEMASVTTRDSNTPSQLPLLPLGGFGLAFLGRLRGTRYGSLNVEADPSTLVTNTLATQFAVTANAKLTNGNFSVASGMPVDNGWATQGSVDFVGGAATLKEVSTSQTRLNQVFVVNPPTVS